jgi:uncharacterized membrane protein
MMATPSVALPEPVDMEPALQPKSRLDSVDLVRGIIMVLMVLDHTRDFFSNVRFDPADLSRTTPALFFTRWVTHFCAPGFMFLAGLGAGLARDRGKSASQMSWFLLTRGVWLIFLDFTVQRLGLTFSLGLPIFALVLWALGASMIALALLIHLPTKFLVAFSLIMVVGHNSLDGLRPERLGTIGGVIWTVLHVPFSPLPSPKIPIILIVYPLVPWIGVMALGYAFKDVMRKSAEERSRIALLLGLCACIGFVVLRATNFYGDPQRWSVQRSAGFTLMSFLNCTKYPPSLHYLLMTLGPLLVTLALFDRNGVGSWARPLVIYGRVPLFYYLLQWPVIHVLALAIAVSVGQPYQFLLGAAPIFAAPEGYGFGLPVVYTMWLLVVLLLLPPCAWFAELKRRRRDVWLSYF